MQQWDMQFMLFVTNLPLWDLEKTGQEGKPRVCVIGSFMGSMQLIDFLLNANSGSFMGLTMCDSF